MKQVYLLVHGAWHGGWCWREIAPRLKNAGHAVFAPDLVGAALSDWTDVVCQILAAQSQPVILIGHSRGGMVISQAAERHPLKILALGYLSGFLLRDGESMLRATQEDGSSLAPPNLVMSTDKQTCAVAESALREVFYGQCAPEMVEFARAHMIVEPTGPLATPVKISDARFGRVPRFYIECLQDKAVPLRLQRKMYGALPCRKVWSLDTDHSPFFSKPDELAACLLELASRAGENSPSQCKSPA
jgi:pimeloyl-ACP methyl ester carboxylesterase